MVPALARVTGRLATRRFLLVTVGLVAVVLFVRSTGSRTNSASASSSTSSRLNDLASQDTRCKYMPWLSGCGGRLSKGATVHYREEHGHLLYPGSSTEHFNDTEPVTQPHPIHKLMKDAEVAWEAKQRRQSRSLKEAIAEYERRYGMPPPKGFTDWYFYAKGKNTRLIDEYDSIHDRILPFMAIPPSVLLQRLDKLQNATDFWMQPLTFTIRLRDQGRSVFVDGPMTEVNHRPDQMLDLLQGFRKWLPDMDLTFSGHDNPWDVVSGSSRARHIAAAKQRKYIKAAFLEDQDDNWDYDGWAAVCPPNSTIRDAAKFDVRSESFKAPPPSFISNHEQAMDVCEHPERQMIHGFSAWNGPRPGLLYPIFAFTSTTMHSDLLVPPTEQYDFPVGVDPEWEDKKEEHVVWRGTTTGADLSNPHMRKWSQRPRLCRLPKQTGELTLPVAYNDRPRHPGSMATFTASASKLAERYFDFKFTGEPAQCFDPIECPKFQKEFEWAGRMSPSQQNEYKYVIDVDGNGWSGRFHRLMASNSLVLKSTIFPEWYTERVQPWLHYVPVATDYTDLWPIMAFFRGDLEGKGAHDDLAKQIATSGKRWAEEYWSFGDMQVYLFRLLLEYARLILRDDDDPTSWDMDPTTGR